MKLPFTLILVYFILFLVTAAKADKIVLLGNNYDSLRARVDYIQAAQYEIKAQYFSIDKDHISFTALALFRDAAKHGVKVKIIVDSMHNLMKPETVAALLNNLDEKATSNIQIKVYNAFNLFKFYRYDKRMHDKGIIIDDKVMIAGGRNIADGYFGKISEVDESESSVLYEDSDALILESKAIRTASQYFDDLWNSDFVKDIPLYDFDSYSLQHSRCNSESDGYTCEQRRESNIKLVKNEEEKFDRFIYKYKKSQLDNQYLPLDWQAKAIDVLNIEYLFDDVKSQNSSLDKPEKNTAAALYNVIGSAMNSVVIVTPYLVITPEQEKLFQNLRKHNVKIQIITNSKASNDVAAAHVGYEKTRALALNLGVKIFEYQGPDTLHAKLALVDSKLLFIGSFNWDYRSQNLNREVGILAHLPDDNSNYFSTDVYEKFARIIRNTCQVNSITECEPVSNVLLADINHQEYLRLLEVAKKREQNNALFFRIFFPLIKGQL